MTEPEHTEPLDDKSWRLLRALQQDGRLALKVLGQVAGLSIAATAERVKRLMESRVVTRITAEVDPSSCGYRVRAIVGITVFQPGKKDLLERLRLAAEVLECHHVAGADSYLITVVAKDLLDLERFLGSINVYGETRTSIVFSTPISRRALVRPGEARA